MFSGCEEGDKEMLMELGEIEKLHVGEECMAGLEEQLGELEYIIYVSDKITSVTLMKEKTEIEERKGSLGKKIATLRNRLQKSRQAEFIADLARHPAEAELQEGVFASLFQEIGGQESRSIRKMGRRGATN